MAGTLLSALDWIGRGCCSVALVRPGLGRTGKIHTERERMNSMEEMRLSCGSACRFFRSTKDSVPFWSKQRRVCMKSISTLCCYFDCWFIYSFVSLSFPQNRYFFFLCTQVSVLMQEISTWLVGMLRVVVLAVLEFHLECRSLSSIIHVHLK